MNKFFCQLYRNYSSESGGIKYLGFSYYPRFPDRPDPPYRAEKLLMVERIRPVKGNPYWDKDLLKKLKLDGKGKAVTILKNIPESNARLWKIKHLVRITPITCPHGLPEEGDYSGTYLKEDGQFVVSRRLKVDPARVEATDKFLSDGNKMDGATLKKQLRLKWLNPFN
ncbi:large ribosomal subunit protein uL30m [Bacillus rossius redtenbacheri]|uniref:large ribosomal subunit protein uL30m n=1 Tax=Bacillus rossius redtenbacheri TaxID=93214 RepID=UPI002FDEB8C7